MKKRIGILTSGGDCPGLNATIRGVAKACYEMMGEDNVEIVGIAEGYYGLINNICRDMKPEEFSGILTRGGTILGTKRQPFKMMQVIGDDNVDKVKNMKETYKKQKLDCLLTLGGNGTHKTSRLLSDEGLNVIGLPKTIDNDIYGTDVTFGFHTAVDIATDALDRLHTTANSHSRILLCEIMGNKAGWLTLNAGIAGGADIILIPEIPYDIDKVCESVLKRSESGKNFSIVAVAEGVFDQNEAQLKKKERARLRAEAGITTATNRIAAQIQQKPDLKPEPAFPDICSEAVVQALMTESLQLSSEYTPQNLFPRKNTAELLQKSAEKLQQISLKISQEKQNLWIRPISLLKPLKI